MSSDMKKLDVFYSKQMYVSLLTNVCLLNVQKYLSCLPASH